MHSPEYERFKRLYKQYKKTGHGISEQGLEKAVDLGLITEEEKNQIIQEA